MNIAHLPERDLAGHEQHPSFIPETFPFAPVDAQLLASASGSQGSPSKAALSGARRSVLGHECTPFPSSLHPATL